MSLMVHLVHPCGLWVLDDTHLMKFQLLLSPTHNVVDGAPSTLLGIVGVGCHSFGEISTVVYPHPKFKCLRCGTVHELKVSVRDDTGQRIDNHDLPISVVIEIR